MDFQVPSHNNNNKIYNGNKNTNNKIIICNTMLFGATCAYFRIISWQSRSIQAHSSIFSFFCFSIVVGMSFPSNKFQTTSKNRHTKIALVCTAPAEWKGCDVIVSICAARNWLKKCLFNMRVMRSKLLSNMMLEKKIGETGWETMYSFSGWWVSIVTLIPELCFWMVQFWFFFLSRSFTLFLVCWFSFFIWLLFPSMWTRELCRNEKITLKIIPFSRWKADNETVAHAKVWEREREMWKNSANEWKKKHKRAQMEYKMRKYLARWYSHQRQWTFGTHTHTHTRSISLPNWSEVCVCLLPFSLAMAPQNATNIEWRMVFWHHAWVYHEHEKIF